MSTTSRHGWLGLETLQPSKHYLLQHRAIRNKWMLQTRVTNLFLGPRAMLWFEEVAS